MKARVLLATALIMSQAIAAECLIGWPGVVGPKSRDGNTEVTVWQEATDGETYLVGGKSDSKDFTEHASCTNGGCAFMATWNKVTQEFSQKAIFTEVQTVIAIVFEPFTDGESLAKKFAMVFSKEEEEKHRLVVNFGLYSKTLGAIVAQSGYTISEPYDTDSYDDFGSLALFE